MAIDPLELTRELIRCASVTPKDEGAQDILARQLEAAGFEIHRIERGGIKNLFARWGARGNGRAFGYNGHTDVVPVGDAAAWTKPPFGAEIAQGYLYGRGATDMKSSVAAFVAAAIDFVTQTPPEGAVILTITGDEEGIATDGTTAILDWMAENGERMDHCLVGEPTCPEVMGEMMKIGRRGSMNVTFTANGVQGHSAYLHKAKNPLPALVQLLSDLGAPLDDGSAHFDPSTLAITSIDVGNPANNVVPAQGRAKVNIRFNDLHSSESLTAMLSQKRDAVVAQTGVEIDMAVQVSGESFITELGELSELIAGAVEAETGLRPEPSTTGGTSDARFIQAHCPVVEFGLVGRRMHQVDERVLVEEIHQLKSIYTRILQGYFT